MSIICLGLSMMFGFSVVLHFDGVETTYPSPLCG